MYNFIYTSVKQVWILPEYPVLEICLCKIGFMFLWNVSTWTFTHRHTLNCTNVIVLFEAFPNKYSYWSLWSSPYNCSPDVEIMIFWSQVKQVAFLSKILLWVFSNNRWKVFFQLMIGQIHIPSIKVFTWRNISSRNQYSHIMLKIITRKHKLCTWISVHTVLCAVTYC